MNPATFPRKTLPDKDRIGRGPSAPRPLLTVKEAAAYLRLSKSTLDKMRLSGTGAEYAKLGRRVVYTVTDLESWVAGRKRRHTAQ
ncbi:MAG TPA: helix-turn-helix domain-containing protein [Xanthobacteraceae bacterium]|nr:helix-turn-helix domain-containing protein [Xanthobacteraceae bacterium]